MIKSPCKIKIPAVIGCFGLSQILGCVQGPMGISYGNLSTSVLQNSFEVSALQILSANCTSCHGTNSGPAGVFDLLDANHLVASGLILPGDSSRSPLINVITSGAMPPNGGTLSMDEQMTLTNWINTK